MSQKFDQPLIELTLAGDTRAFAKLVARYQHMVYTLVFRLVGNTEEAEEVAQDSFLKAYLALPNFKGDSKFSTWLYRIAYNRGLDCLQKKKRQPNTDSMDAYPDLDIAVLENNWDTIDAKDRKLAIKKAVESLQGDDGIVITLFYYEELSLNEIAHVLGLEVNTAKVKLHRARKKLGEALRKILEPEIIQGYERK